MTQRQLHLLVGVPAIMVAAVFWAIGCSGPSKASSSKVSTETPACCATAPGAENATGSVETGTLVVCTFCGQFEGVDACCRMDIEECHKCGLHEDSPGCCAVNKGSGVIILVCASCGHFKGTDDCCKPGQPTCNSCLLVKASPGCCQIK